MTRAPGRPTDGVAVLGDGAPMGPLERERARADLAFVHFVTTGQPERPRRAFQRGLAAAQVGRDLALEATCLLRLSTIHHHCGDFESARLTLDRAAGVYADIGSGPGSQEVPFHRVGRGVLAALDGDYDVAVGWLEEGVLRARRTGDPEVALIAEALAAPWFSFTDDQRLPASSRPPVLARRLAEAGLHDWMPQAHRTEVTLLLVDGRFAEAGRVGHRYATTMANPGERVRVLLPAAWGELWSGNSEAAAATFALAAADAASVGARFTATMALFGVAEADPSRATDVLLDAITDAGSGPAWTRLWDSRPAVRVETLGARRVLVGDRPVRFRSERAEELFVCVALAGPGGIHWADLAALVWPETTDPRRAASSVSTHTANARRELATEGWRLRREGPTLWIEPTNLTIDLDEHGGAVPDGAAFLPGWEDRPWVAAVA